MVLLMELVVDPWLYWAMVLLILITIALIAVHSHTKYKLRQLPTVTWRPRFVNYHPGNHADASKMAPSTITGILPRMRRLNGPFGMYGTVYGISTAVVHMAHPTPVRAVLIGTASEQQTNGQRRQRERPSSCCGAIKRPAYNHFKNFSGEGVFTADGEAWREKRASVIHCLLRGISNPKSQNSLRLEREANRAAKQVMNELSETQALNIVPIIQRATIGLIYRLITHQENGPEDASLAQDDALAHVLDSSSVSSLSSLKNSQSTKKEDEAKSSILKRYLTSVTHIRMIILAQSRSFWFLLPRWIYSTCSAMYKEEERTMGPIRAFAQQAIDSAKPSSPLAMLRDRPSHSTPKDILDEAITLLFAGQDTSAATLSWTLHLLSLYPGIQDRAAAEVIGTTSDGAFLTKKEVSKWIYLDAVLKEAMRLYPVAPLVVRALPFPITIQDTTTTSVTLPKGAMACVWIYSLHRNPEIWERPNEFDPERWFHCTPPLGAYMPFAAGPRNCVGQPLAHVVLRVILARLLQQYRFVDDRLTKGINPQDLLKDMQAGFTVLPQGGVDLRVEQRCTCSTS